MLWSIVFGIGQANQVGDRTVISLSAKCVLLDIEGTTSSIAFVYEVMFAYVRKHLHSFLVSNWDIEGVQKAIEQMAQDAQVPLSNWVDSSIGALESLARVEQHVLSLMDADQKSTGLKALQGLLWKNGFDDGSLRAHLFPEVPSAIARWKKSGLDVRIYSSGSIAAQKLFFGHTESGSLLSNFSAHYDTTIGSKKESESYRKIAADIGCPTSEVVFVTDVLAEMDAASQAGMQVIASCRPGNVELPSDVQYQRVYSFDELDIQSSKSA